MRTPVREEHRIVTICGWRLRLSFVCTVQRDWGSAVYLLTDVLLQAQIKIMEKIQYSLMYMLYKTTYYKSGKGYIYTGPTS
jgi:hypothetical protein